MLKQSMNSCYAMSKFIHNRSRAIYFSMILKYRSYNKHKAKIQELMNDKFEDFHKGNRTVEERLKRANEAKLRTFMFNQNGKYNESALIMSYFFVAERQNQIEKDNLNLLAKLEVIKKKGTQPAVSQINSMNFMKTGSVLTCLINLDI